MGYYSNFELTTKPHKEIDLNDLETMSGGYVWDRQGSSYRIEEQVKWYEHDEHMKKFSKKKAYKDVTFVLDVEGEESGDIWRAYYKNGKSCSYQAELTFPPFNEEDLK
jgi:hypothetical protein